MAIFSGIGLSRSKNKLGSMVLMNRAGTGVVAREYVAEVKNPRTTSQMRGRTKWANLVNFYRLSKGWLPMAFENKKANQSDYNKFMSLNVANASVYLTKELAASGAVVVDNFIVSYGSLRTIEQRYEGGEAISDLCTGSLVVTASTTIAELSKALLQNTPSLRDGDQISYISYLDYNDNGVPRSTCRAFELPVDTTRTAELISDYFPEFLCHSKNDGGKQVMINTRVPSGAFTWVLSRTISGKTYVSTQKLCVDSFLNAMYSTPEARTAAIDSYGSSETAFLDSNHYAESEPAGIPVSIIAVVNDNGLVAPGEVIMTSSIQGKPLSVIFQGIAESLITRVRVTTNEGRLFSLAITGSEASTEGTYVTTETLPDSMGVSNAYVTSISLMQGDYAVATSSFSRPESGEMD